MSKVRHSEYRQQLHLHMTPNFTITNAITRDLTMIERARGFLDAATLSDEWVRRMSQRALLLEAHHTTHIEGTQLTLEQSQAVWEGKDAGATNADDVRELLNYRDAFQLVSEYLSSGLPITETLIRSIHQKLVEGVRGEEGKPGAYRLVQNYVVSGKTGKPVYTPPPPEAVPGLMQDLVAWLQADSEIHPVLIAGIAQFELVHIHPFVDGNGRTSRLLSTLCMYRAGYDFKRLFTISEYYDRDRQAFYRAIQSVREQNMDLTSWLEFFTKGLATQLDEVKTRGEQVIRIDVVSKTHQLNDRQSRILERLYLQVEGTGIRDLEPLFEGVSRRTLQRDLSSMIEKGLVLATGETNNLIYQLASRAV
jgi:Fic family protein